MAETSDLEDDYLSMSFAEPAAKETSIQRIARLKNEAAERGHVLSKKERAEQEKAARDTALATKLDKSNKGAQMLAKMGYAGGALGKAEDARTRPVEVQLKDDRGGIGMESEKKRKIREAAAEMEGTEKRRKVDETEYRERTRAEREEKRSEGQMWSAMRTLEGFETGGIQFDTTPAESGDAKEVDSAVPSERKPLLSIKVLWRPLVKRRLEKERQRRMRHDLEQSLSRRADYDDPEADEDDKLAFGYEVEELKEEDPELDEFETLSFAERLEKIIEELRQKYNYCFWCKYRYPDNTMDGCPGLTEDEHG